MYHSQTFHTQAYSFKTACSKSIFRESNIPPLLWLRPAIPLSRFLVNNLTHSPSCWFCCCWHSVIAQCWGCCAYCCCCEGPKITLSCLVRGKLGWQHQVSSKHTNNQGSDLVNSRTVVNGLLEIPTSDTVDPGPPVSSNLSQLTEGLDLDSLTPWITKHLSCSHRTWLRRKNRPTPPPWLLPQ